MTTRSIVMVRKGLVASSHELSSFVGARVLEKGGNVIDAAIATSAMLCVVQNNLCGLGGDLFALIKLGGFRVVGLNGSGRAGKNATIDFYKGKGENEIPKRGPLSALTVPGIVHAWGELLEKYGSMELDELLQPAIYYAESGLPLTRKYVQSIKVSKPLLGRYVEFARIFLPNGEPPDSGEVLKQRDLALTLRKIEEEGPEGFYKGDLALRIVKGIEEQGGILALEDFASHSSTWNEPLKTDYRGIDVYESAPNSQAASVLLWLNMLEHFDVKKLSDKPKAMMKVMLDTYRKVNSERSRKIGDPEFHKLPQDFTSKKYAENILHSSLEIKESHPSAGDHGDTTYFAVGDAEGNCVSMIQSNYMGFGSGLVPKGTGIVLHNRGVYFTLDRTHHNSLLPGKRTFHTLCASIGEKDGKTLFALGSMGGDIQPQIHVQLMTKLLDLGMDLQSVIDAPRWAVPGTIYETPTSLQMEEELAGSISGGIDANLSLEKIEKYSSLTGHAQAIFFKNGALYGAADPRGDGAAVGY